MMASTVSSTEIIRSVNATPWIKGVLSDQRHDGHVDCPYTLERMLLLFQRCRTRQERFEMILRPFVEDDQAAHILEEALMHLLVCDYPTFC